MRNQFSLSCRVALALGVASCAGDGPPDPVVEVHPDVVETPCASGTFGSCTIGSNLVTASADYKRASAFALAIDGASVAKLTAYLDGGGATTGSQSAIGIVYAADGGSGAPGTRLCQTSQITISAGASARWVDLPIVGSCTLAAGTYYLGLLTSTTPGVMRYYGTTASGALVHDANAFASGPSSTFGSFSRSDVLMSISASYTAATGGGGSTPGCTRYVATSGSDSASGTATSPFRTLQHAADVVVPGDVVCVEDGTYGASSAGGTIVRLSRGGTASSSSG
jgi:hypothetical protein